MAWANFAAGLGRFANAVPQLLFPGLGSGGVDPAIAQQLRSQALMQMGAGLASGQDIAKSYGLGQASGYEALQGYQRQQTLEMAKQDRASDQEYRGLLMKDREQKLKDDEDTRRRQKEIDAILTPPLPEKDEDRLAELRRRADKVRALDIQSASSLIQEANSIESKLLQREQLRLSAGNTATDNARLARQENLLRLQTRAQGLGQVADLKAKEAERIALKQMSENEPGTPLWNSAANVYRQYAGKDVPRDEYGEPTIRKGAGLGASGAGADVIAEARAAIARGAPREKVIERLRLRGITPPADL